MIPPKRVKVKVPLGEDRTEISWGPMYARCAGLELRKIPVIMVHGFVVSSSYMVPTAEILASYCPVYAIDLPGFGRSCQPDRPLTFDELADSLEEWLLAKGFIRVHLLGNSMGCQIIARYASRYPGRIDRIVMQAPTVDRHARSFWPQFWRQLRNSHNERPSLGPTIWKDYFHAGIRRVFFTLDEVLADRIEESLPHLGMPVLVVRGANDSICPAEWVAEVVELLPRGELKVVPGGGHALNYSMPLELVRVMRPFLGL